MNNDYLPIKAKSILVPNKGPSHWFGVKYNFNIYRACPHNCIYCDSRSECYQIDNFQQVQVKTNSTLLLDQTLAKKRDKCIIGTGAMSDPYLPLEDSLFLTRDCLKIINQHKFGFHVVTKSPLIVRDLELFKEAAQVHFSAALTITTTFEEMAKIVEPNVALPADRLKAIETLSKNNLFVGVLMMPILPFLQDNKKNISSIIRQSADSGAKFIFPWFSVTLRDRQRDYFFQKLDIHYPGLRKQYEKRYGNAYECASPNAKHLYTFFEEECKKYKIITKMENLPWVKKELS